MSTRTIKPTPVEMAVLLLLYYHDGAKPLTVARIEESILPSPAMPIVEQLMEVEWVAPTRNERTGKLSTVAVGITRTGETLIDIHSEEVIREARDKRDKMSKSQRGMSERTRIEFEQLKAVCKVFRKFSRTNAPRTEQRRELEPVEPDTAAEEEFEEEDELEEDELEEEYDEEGEEVDDDED